jgi:hypothetical protein
MPFMLVFLPLTGMDLKWFWRENYVFLLPTYPQVYVGISTKFLVLDQKKTQTNKISNSALGVST